MRLLLLLMLLLVPGLARAWPERPVTLVVPFGAGAGADILARLLQPGLQQAWGQPVVVQNVPGAGGSVGVERVVRAAPDGHTLVISGDAAIVVRLSMQPPLPYDPRRDLVPISLLIRTPNLLVVRAEGGPADLAALVRATKAAPGATYGHTGPGTSIQIGSEMLAQMAGLDLTGVGYPAMPSLAQELLAGRLQFSFVSAISIAPLVREGRLRALAVSSAQRLPAFPQVPTVAEQGYPGFDATAWFGLLAPAATPSALVQRIHADVHAQLAAPAMRTRLEEMAAIVVDSTPAEFAALITAEIPRMAAVLRRAGIAQAQ